jgi:arsenate reductase (thioredoxin)
MAAALLDRRANGRLSVLSAGSEPSEGVSAVVVEAMREVGVDLTAARPRRLEDAAVRSADAVVTMGCGDACPVYPGKLYEDWEIEDPAGKKIEDVRRIRDEIDGRVRRLVDRLGP